MENYQQLSEELLQTRLKLDLTVEQISKKSGISQENIKSLENGNYYKLPSGVYVQGYLRSLSQIYGLEPNKVLAKYKEEYQSDLEPGLLNPKPLKNNRFVFTPKKIVSLSMAIVFLFAGGYLFWQIQGLTSAPPLIINNLENNEVITDGSIMVSGKTDPGAILTINKQRVTVENNGHFSKTILLSEGENIISIRAENRFEKFSEVNKRVVASPSPRVLGEQVIGPQID